MNVRIFDTTLRDGEQSPGASMTPAARLQIAKALDGASVDVIEGGFPASSASVHASVRDIANVLQHASLAALARLNRGDIDSAWSAIAGARKPVLYSFIATSDEHIVTKLRSNRADVIATIESNIRYMSSLTRDVMFAAEDATRSDRDFLVRAFNVAVNAGATTVVLADTVGCMLPEEYGALVRYVRERLPKNVALATHCHDDLGLAVANTLEGVRNGATEIHATVNGIGERAGNCSLEEVVVTLRLRADYYRSQVGLKTERLAALSELVAEATNMPVAKNKAIVGANAFLHESGIHQDGVLKQRSLYEFIPAEMVGREPGQLFLGRNSGRSGLRSRCEALGLPLTKNQLKAVYNLFISAANDGCISDADIARMVGDVVERDYEIA